MERESFEPGAVIDGKYRLEHLLGSGGMGQVFAATHLMLRERVAIKVLRPERTDRARLGERFLREARVLASIKSPHVVRVFDVGSLPDQQPFIVMEYLEGENLAQHLARVGPLAAEQAIDFVLQATEGIAEAHALGIVHRDLKPANLFLQRRASGAPLVKVLDFGVSLWSTETAAVDESGLTSTHALVGSPAYMSPEQLTEPASVDSRTDVWALGVILYELLTGKQPFRGATLAVVCNQILQAKPLEPERSELPSRLSSVALRALRKDRDRRFASVQELAEALAPWGSEKAHASLVEIRALARGTAAGSSPTGVAEPRPALGSETLTGSVVRRPSSSPLSHWRIAAGFSSLALVSAFALWFSARPPETHDQQPSSTSDQPNQPLPSPSPAGGGPREVSSGSALPAPSIATSTAAATETAPASVPVPVVERSVASTSAGAPGRPGKNPDAPASVPRAAVRSASQSGPHRVGERHPDLPPLKPNAEPDPKNVSPSPEDEMERAYEFRK